MRREFNACTVYPFVLLRHKKLLNNDTLVRHEQIHLQQQRELLLLPFFLIYVLEFLFHLMRSKKWMDAYRSISFEKEAYRNESNADYLSERKSYAMWRSST